MLIPVGDFHQELIVAEKQPNGQIRKWTAELVRFVPMTGEALRGSARP